MRDRAVTDPCKRHKAGEVVKFRVFSNDRRTTYVIGEVRRCARCGQDMEPRIVRGAIRNSVREALHAYGCTAEEAEQYMATHHPEEAMKEKLVADTLRDVAAIALWPFPCSATHNQDGTRKRTSTEGQV